MRDREKWHCLKRTLFNVVLLFSCVVCGSRRQRSCWSTTFNPSTQHCILAGHHSSCNSFVLIDSLGIFFCWCCVILVLRLTYGLWLKVRPWLRYNYLCICLWPCPCQSFFFYFSRYLVVVRALMRAIVVFKHVVMCNFDYILITCIVWTRARLRKHSYSDRLKDHLLIPSWSSWLCWKIWHRCQNQARHVWPEHKYI